MARYLVLVVALMACSFETDYRDTRYDCSGRCPSGYECVDGHCEVPVLDGGATDAAGAVDASEVDASEKLTCDEQFGSAPGYQLCSETAASCSFDVNLDNGTCDAACESFGSTCISARDSDDGFPCIDSGPTTCGVTHNYVICTCSR